MEIMPVILVRILFPVGFAAVEASYFDQTEEDDRVDETREQQGTHKGPLAGFNAAAIQAALAEEEATGRKQAALDSNHIKRHLLETVEFAELRQSIGRSYD